MIKRIFGKRMLAITALLLLLATVLTGCGGCGGTATQITASEIKDESIQVVKNELGDAAKDPFLTASQLNSIAQMLAKTTSASLNSRELLLAASRGYDMLKEGFNDAAADPVKVGSDDPIAATIAVIKKANETAKDENKITFDFSATEEVDGVQVYKFNETDMYALVNAFKVNVALSSESGIWDGILTAIGTVLNWLTKLGFGSYIIGICIFAIVIEILMLPFAIKQQKNSIKQAKLRPKEKAIRDKYKNRNDQASVQKMQQEIQEFYQRENFSPYSGCLQLFLQLPIIMALYSIVIDPLHYVLGQTASFSSAFSTYFTTARAAGGFGGKLVSGNGTIEVLSALRENAIESFEGLSRFGLFNNGADVYNRVSQLQGDIPNFKIAGVNFGLTPSFETLSILILVPILTFVVYFFSSKITRKLMNSQPPANSQIEARQQACSNTMMDVMMPALSTYFTFVVPAIIGVYWVFRCLLSIVKQYIMSKVMPLPVFTEEDYKAAEKEMNVRVDNKAPKNKSGRVVRSLHHIDDEDFEDTAEKARAHKAALEAQEAAEAEKKKPAKNGLVEGAALKKDDKPERTEKTTEKKSDDDQNTETTEEETK